MDNKVIYLKSLFKTFKPKEKLPEDLKIEMAKLNLISEVNQNKPLDPFKDKKAGRKFVLDNMEDMTSPMVPEPPIPAKTIWSIFFRSTLSIGLARFSAAKIFQLS